MKEIEATQLKLAALEVLAGEEGTEKEAGKGETMKCPTCGTKVLKATGYCLKCKKKIKGGDSKKDEDKDDKKEDKKKEGKKEEKKEDKKDKKKEAAANIVASLDEIAGLLENQNDPELLKLAYDIDKVSDVIEGKKEASTLESDEPFMRKFFKAGDFESDSDEPYMKEFNTDTSTELKDKFQRNQLGKDASVKLPYQIVK